MLADEWNAGQVALVNTQFKRLRRIGLHIWYKKKNKGDFAHAPSPQLTRAVALVYTR